MAKRVKRSKTGFQHGTTAYFESKAIERVVKSSETSERRIRGSGNRVLSKALATVHKHGLSVKIGSAHYPVPDKLAVKVFKHIKDNYRWSRSDRALIGTVRYVARTGEDISRSGKSRRIVLTPNAWKMIKQLASDALVE